MRCRRHQAYGRTDEPRGRRADLPYAGHCRRAWTQLADAAIVLGALTGPDSRDPQTAASAGHFFRNYRQFVNPDGLKGARIGIARQFTGATPETDAIFEDAVQVMRMPARSSIAIEFPSFDDFNADQSEIIVLIYEFKRDLNAYLATRSGVPVTTLAD